MQEHTQDTTSDISLVVLLVTVITLLLFRSSYLHVLQWTVLLITYQAVHLGAVSVLSYWFNKAFLCKTFVSSFTDMWQVLCMHWTDFWYLEICSGVKMLLNFHPCGLTFHSGSAHHLSMWADLSQWQCTPPVHLGWPFTVAVHTTCPCGLTYHSGSAHHLSVWADLSQWQCTPPLQ